MKDLLFWDFGDGDITESDEWTQEDEDEQFQELHEMWFGKTRREWFE